MLRNIPKSSKEILLDFYNKVWSNGYLPQDWKESLIIPIHKTGKDPTKAESYRPVSLTSNLCKTLEAMVTKRLQHYLESNNCLTPNQSGYRKTYSTTDHLVRLQHHIRKAQHRKQYTIAVFLDFSKAFDMVWKNGLIYKVKQKGIQGVMLNFINDFMTNRSFRLKAEGHITDNYKLENGTPQGSIISPTLFNVMIDDLFKGIPQKVNTSQFADDGALWVSHYDLHTAVETMQTALNKVNEWTQQWGFQLSTSKTKSIVFRRKRQPSQPIKLSIKGSVIKQETSVKFLGVTFDETLSWNQHINELVGKCKKDLNILKMLSHTKWGSNKEMLLILYKSLIKSKLHYGAEAWQDTSETNIKKLKTIQSKAYRYITGSLSNTPTELIAHELGELPLEAEWEENATNYIVRSQHKACITELNTGKKLVTTKKIPPPFGAKIPQINTTYGIDKINISTRPFSDKILCPPDIPDIEVDTYLLKHINKKEETVANLATTQAYIDQQYSKVNHLHIYTDGSKNEKGQVGTGIHAAHITEKELAYNLPNQTSIFTAELAAIRKALQLHQNCTNENVVIFSDSLSALQAIQNKSDKNRQELLHQIYSAYNTLTKSKNVIYFVWVPSHIGLLGNEKADQSAKAGLSHHNKIDIPYSKTEVKSTIHSITTKKYNKSFRKWQHSQYYKIQPNKITKVHNYHTLRKLDIVITRLRLNSIRNNVYLHKIGKAPNNLCNHCKIKDTIQHILFDCKLYEKHRNCLVSNTSSTNTVDSLLANTNNYPHLAKFLLQTNLYKKI